MNKTEELIKQIERKTNFINIPIEIIEDAFEHNKDHSDCDLWAFILYEKFTLNLSSEEISEVSDVPLGVVKSTFEEYEMIDKEILVKIYDSIEKYKPTLSLSDEEIDELERLRKDSNLTI